MKLKIKLMVPHKDGCLAVKQAGKDGRWPTPWGYLKEAEYRSSNGCRLSRGGHHRWWWVICNDIACPALAIVREEEILIAIHKEASGGLAV